MNLIVWGTGKLFQKYRELLSQFRIIKFCDNNSKIQGNLIEGIEIIAPWDLKKYSFTYVVIMTYAADQVYCQIRDMGIAAEKILLYSQLWQLIDMPVHIYVGKKKTQFQEWIVGTEKSVLLISHNFSYTGIAVALKNMAMVLKHMGCSVLMAAMETGPFVQELEAGKIAYIDNLEIGYQSGKFLEMLDKFTVIILGTFSLYQLAASLEGWKKPILWWIHESDKKYYTGRKSLPLRKNGKFLAGGKRVKKVFKEYYENVRIETLQYCIPDSNRGKICQREKGQMVFAVIGTVDVRKAQDLLLEAFIELPTACQNLFKIIIIGRIDESDAKFAEKIKAQADRIKSLEWIPEMSQNELDRFYENIDVLVCPSREDPMPIVVTQAMMHEKVCVVSDNVGQAEFIRQYENGFVFPGGDSSALMRIVKWLLDNRDESCMIGRAARKVYEEEFTEKVMERKLKMILKELPKDGTGDENEI